MESKIKRYKQDKFMIRIPDSLFDAVTRLAIKHDRSMNSEICHALDQWLSPRSEIRMIHHLLECEDLVDIDSVCIPSHTDSATPDRKKTMTRFGDGQLQRVREASFSKDTTMNHQFNVILNWWSTINSALTKKLANGETPA